eukprot:CAMPEP_0196658808 /NCGR_PEP_ID=MMETSP1086-20130531/31713_1 /TAXON_ID=77921 /ORGANISM="Cyanoptyche  gloeocystis , Strain SAG4.97" /LENGTH=138 /DNA_ID=CAMNT_0041992551 /DNA_START=142 /DNA_END=555 /DNA_ORIENTATION=-
MERDKGAGQERQGGTSRRRGDVQQKGMCAGELREKGRRWALLGSKMREERTVEAETERLLTKEREGEENKYRKKGVRAGAVVAGCCVEPGGFYGGDNMSGRKRERRAQARQTTRKGKIQGDEGKGSEEKRKEYVCVGG